MQKLLLFHHLIHYLIGTGLDISAADNFRNFKNIHAETCTFEHFLSPQVTVKYRWLHSPYRIISLFVTKLQSSTKLSDDFVTMWEKVSVNRKFTHNVATLRYSY